MRFPTNKLMSILICSFPVIACANNTNSGSMPLDTASVRFNRDALRGFGIDDSVAAYFAKGMRFTPGEHRAKLTINGMTSGNVKVNFNRDGELCVGEQWMQQLGVKVPEFDADNQSTENCQPIKKVYANAVVNYSPDSQNVELIVPAEALLDPTGTRPTGYATGGTALKVNYSLLRSDSEYSDNKDTYTSAGLESSLSIADWRLSNSTMYSTSDNGKNNLDNIYTYVEHTFAASATNLQAGGINLATPMLSGAPIYGVQFMPDPALTQSGAGGVDVSGVARSAQARIEIKQNGQLIYTSLVPAGPFTLRSVPVQNRSSDLHVTVVESDGQESHFTVFSSAFRLPVTAMPSWLFAVGRIRDVADADDQPMVASGAWSQPLFRYYNGTVSSILSEDYQAIGGGLELPPFGSMITSLQLRGAQDNNHNEKGSQAGISVNGQLPLGLSFSVADTWSSRGYRDLLDSVRNVDISRDQHYADDDDPSNFNSYNKNELTASLSWSNETLGAFMFSYSGSKSYISDGDSDITMLSWSKSFKHFSTNVNFQRETGTGGEDSLWINFYIPLGKHSLNSWMRRDDGEMRLGTGVNGTILGDTSYYANYERNQETDENLTSGGINANLHYTRQGVSAGTYGSDGHYSSMSLDGGGVAHASGVTFSPERVSDTFAIAQLGQKKSGVKIQTPQGSVWTDWRGMAVIPSLPAYREAFVEVDNRTVAKDTDVGNGVQSMKQGRYSVGTINFNAFSSRRVMFQNVQYRGQDLPPGSAVMDSHGNYLTSVVEPGLFFVNLVSDSDGRLQVTLADAQQCVVRYELPESSPADTVYETVTATCL